MLSLAVRECGLAHKTNIFALGEFDCSFKETFTRDRTYTVRISFLYKR